MAEIVNLRTARKARSRTKARAEADANAAKFGRTRAQRDLERSEADNARTTLDAHRRDRSGGEEPER